MAVLYKSVEIDTWNGRGVVVTPNEYFFSSRSQ